MHILIIHNPLPILDLFIMRLTLSSVSVPGLETGPAGLSIQPKVEPGKILTPGPAESA